MRHAVIFCLVAALMLSACAGGATPAPAEAPPEPTNTPAPPTSTPLPPTPTPISTPEPDYLGGGSGRLAFISDRLGPGTTNLFMMSVEGEDVVRVSEGVTPAYPDFSPDGQTIAFSSMDGGSWAIYTIETDGSNLTQVTDFSSAVADWSPDGQRLVFNSDHRNEAPNVPDLYAMNVDGTDLVELVDSPETLDFNARWSPDGSQICFSSDRAGAINLFVMDADGSNITQLTTGDGTDQQPDWSPDGSRIAFVSDRTGNRELYVMDADGGNLTQLTETSATEGGPNWSPDGQYLAYHASVEGITHIFIMSADGSQVTQVTDDDYNSAFPIWQPRLGS